MQTKTLRQFFIATIVGVGMVYAATGISGTPASTPATGGAPAAIAAVETLPVADTVAVESHDASLDNVAGEWNFMPETRNGGARR